MVKPKGPSAGTDSARPDATRESPSVAMAALQADRLVAAGVLPPEKAAEWANYLEAISRFRHGISAIRGARSPSERLTRVADLFCQAVEAGQGPTYGTGISDEDVRVALGRALNSVKEAGRRLSELEMCRDESTGFMSSQSCEMRLSESGEHVAKWFRQLEHMLRPPPPGPDPDEVLLKALREFDETMAEVRDKAACRRRIVEDDVAVLVGKTSVQFREIRRECEAMEAKLVELGQLRTADQRSVSLASHYVGLIHGLAGVFANLDRGLSTLARQFGEG